VGLRSAYDQPVIQSLREDANMWQRDVARRFCRKCDLTDKRILPIDLPRAAIADDFLTSHADAVVAYHFFRDGQPESLVDVLRHLVYQQLSQPTGTSKVALDLHRKSKSYNAPCISATVSTNRHI
jgi:hypothetical protein